MYVLESPIHADVALIKAEARDRWGIWSTQNRAQLGRSWRWPPSHGGIGARDRRHSVMDPENIVTPDLRERS